MSVYLDASLLVALFTNDAHTGRAHQFLTTQRPSLMISDFGSAEFSSAVARRVRSGELTASEAQAAFAAFDSWTSSIAQKCTIASADMLAAQGFVRRLDLNLRAPDAIHIAIARRMDATLATFDQRMADSAVVLGLVLAPA